jgi:hypothetical protein
VYPPGADHVFPGLAASFREEDRPRPLAIDPLEERALLRTTVYLDFGLDLPADKATTRVAVSTPENPSLRDIFGAETGPNLVPSLRDGQPDLLANSNITLRPLALTFDFDGSGNVDRQDLVSLQNAVLHRVQRAFEPFDVDVKIAQATGLADMLTEVEKNGGGAPGQRDAYVFLGTITSAATMNSPWSSPTRCSGRPRPWTRSSPTSPEGPFTKPGTRSD